MTTFRAFRNTDPPALVDLWNRGLPEKGVVGPLSPHEFDMLVVGKIGFDRAGLIVAEDEGHVVGFAHAGFGPSEPRGPSHRLDPSMGTVAMLVTDPEHQREEAKIEIGLLTAAEAYLRSQGVKVFYAGGQAPLNPFYSGIYGGSEFAGILDSHRGFSLAVIRAGYEPVARTILLEADLSVPEPRDPKSTLLRRQLSLKLTDDAMIPCWWEALALGLFRPCRFDLFEKSLNQVLGSAWTWEIAGGAGLGDGRSRTGLIHVQVDPGHRRKGYGRHLVGEIMRHARAQNSDVLAVQTSAENQPALGLYRSLGFEQVDSSTLYRLPPHLSARSSIGNPIG